MKDGRILRRDRVHEMADGLARLDGRQRAVACEELIDQLYTLSEKDIPKFKDLRQSIESAIKKGNGLTR